MNMNSFSHMPLDVLNILGFLLDPVLAQLVFDRQHDVSLPEMESVDSLAGSMF